MISTVMPNISFRGDQEIWQRPRAAVMDDKNSEKHAINRFQVCITPTKDVSFDEIHPGDFITLCKGNKIVENGLVEEKLHDTVSMVKSAIVSLTSAFSEYSKEELKDYKVIKHGHLNVIV